MSTQDDKGLHIAVDIGGTFTDGIATLADTGKIWIGKTLTTPDDPGEAVSTVIRDILARVRRDGADVHLVEVVHGTTLVTNTLIERKGATTALITTRGMRDSLDIGREWRYDLYDLDLAIPAPLVPPELRMEVDERLNAAGRVVRPLTEQEMARVAEWVRGTGVQSVAISLLHAYINGEHERRLGLYLAGALPDVAVSLSSELAAEIKEFERTSSVVANAYVKPIVEKYLRELHLRLADIQSGVPLRIMVSSGGFSSADAAAHAPIFLLESGPAAGVLSALNTAAEQGIGQVLAFDMGGTTAKACVIAHGEAPIAFSFECARVHRFKRGSGLPILIPSIDLIEIGAGGGSIATVNRLGLLNVGPESAGSVPGPASYGLGGEQPTVTDADLVLGYLNPGNFLGGEMALSREKALQAMATVADQIDLSSTEVAWGIHDMVNENMASAARIHIAEKGHDPRDFTVVATGGAGPVHVVEVARKLRIGRVLASVAAGAGSCLGMLAAPARSDRAWSQPALLELVEWDDVRQRFADLRGDIEAELREAGADLADIRWIVGAEMRYYGQGDNVSVQMPYDELGQSAPEAFRQHFEAAYQRLYGHLVPGARPQILTWRLTGLGEQQTHRFSMPIRPTGQVPAGRREIYLPISKRFEPVDVYQRYDLLPGTRLEGPLVLEERESTLVVPVKADVDVLPDFSVSIQLKEFE